MPAKPKDKAKDKKNEAGQGDQKNTQFLQQRLADLGYGVKVDGVHGPQTRNAIKLFQHDHGLRHDGEVGAATTAALRGTSKESLAELRKSRQAGGTRPEKGSGRASVSRPTAKATDSTSTPAPEGEGQVTTTRGRRLEVRSGDHRVVIYEQMEEAESVADCPMPHGKMAGKGIKRCPSCKRGLRHLREASDRADRFLRNSGTRRLAEAEGNRALEGLPDGFLDEATLIMDRELAEAAGSLAKASRHKHGLESKPGGKDNWVERAGPGGHGGQLPAYIQHIALAIHRKRGLPKSQAIAIAIGTVKRWARGGGDVDANTRAAAAKALAEWEKLKAKSHAKSAAKND